MKRRISLLLVFVLVISAFLTACRGSEETADKTEDTNDKEEEIKEEEKEEEEKEEEDEKEEITLRFSWWGGDARRSNGL